MAKGQKNSSREAKKPKSTTKKTAVAAPSFVTPSSPKKKPVA